MYMPEAVLLLWYAIYVFVCSLAVYRIRALYLRHHSERFRDETPKYSEWYFVWFYRTFQHLIAYVFPTQSTKVFCIIIRLNRDYLFYAPHLTVRSL